MEELKLERIVGVTLLNKLLFNRTAAGL